VIRRPIQRRSNWPDQRPTPPLLASASGSIIFNGAKDQSLSAAMTRPPTVKVMVNDHTMKRSIRRVNSSKRLSICSRMVLIR